MDTNQIYRVSDEYRGWYLKDNARRYWEFQGHAPYYVYIAPDDEQDVDGETCVLVKQVGYPIGAYIPRRFLAPAVP